MKRRDFVFKLGVASLLVSLPVSSFAKTKRYYFSNQLRWDEEEASKLKRIVGAKINLGAYRARLNSLRIDAGQQHKLKGVEFNVNEWLAQCIANDFKAGRVTKCDGVFFAETELALLLSLGKEDL